MSYSAISFFPQTKGRLATFLVGSLYSEGTENVKFREVIDVSQIIPDFPVRKNLKSYQIDLTLRKYKQFAQA